MGESRIYTFADCKADHYPQRPTFQENPSEPDAACADPRDRALQALLPLRSISAEARGHVESSLTGEDPMSMTKRSREYEEMMREQAEQEGDPHEELAYQIWADDGGAHRDEPHDAEPMES